MKATPSVADQIRASKEALFCIRFNMLYKVIPQIQRDPEAMAKIRARVEENRRKAALANG